MTLGFWGIFSSLRAAQDASLLTQSHPWTFMLSHMLRRSSELLLRSAALAKQGNLFSGTAASRFVVRPEVHSAGTLGLSGTVER